MQPEAEVTRKVDILFVADTSGSLQDKRVRIADGIDAFVAAMPATVDYRVSVMLAHGSRSPHSGMVYAKASHGPVMKSDTQSLSQIRSDLHYLMLNADSDYYADGGEEMMYSFLKGTEGGKLTSNRAKGFFRSDAALAVVFMTDENDICATYPAGVTPVPDLDGTLERDAKARDCAGVTPSAVIQRIKQIQSDGQGHERPWVVGAVAFNDVNHVPHVNGRDENEYFYGLDQVIALGHGISIDVLRDNYALGLASIGSLVTSKLTLITEFPLGHPNVAPETIQVHVDNHAVPYQLDAALNEVRLQESDAGGSRSTVDVAYCLKPEVTPSPSPSVTPSPSPSVTPSPSPSVTPQPSVTPSASPTITPSPQPSVTPSPSPSPSACVPGAPGCDIMPT